jgi:hypothetical protein
LGTIEEKSCCFHLMQISFFLIARMRWVGCLFLEMHVSLTALHILYERLPPEQLHTTQSLISTTWEQSQGASGEGRQMTIDLIRFGHKMRAQLVSGLCTGYMSRARA